MLIRTWRAGEGNVHRRATNTQPHYLGYAYECLARAASVMGDRSAAQRCLAEAHKLAAAVDEADERQQLLDHLETIAC